MIEQSVAQPFRNSVRFCGGRLPYHVNAMHDDSALLRQYALGNSQEAFAEFVRHHVDAVYSAALRRVGGDTHLAEDVTQQVFAAAARKSQALSRHPVLSAWLHQATRNEAANSVRAERRRKAREQEAVAMEQNSPEPVHDTEWSQVAPALDEAIDRLAASDRAAIVLRFFERRSFPEMAAELSISQDAARMRVERALERLRARLSQSGIASSAAALGTVLANNAVAAAPAGLADSVAVSVGTTIAATGWATGPLGFMATMKANVTIALIAAAALGTAAYETVEFRETRLAIRDAKMGVTWRAPFERRRDEFVAETMGRLASLHGLLRSKQQTYSDPKEMVRRFGFAPEAIEAGDRFLQRHPEVAVALTEFCRANVRRFWEPGLRKRNVTPDHIEQMIDFQLYRPQSAIVLRIRDRPIVGPDGENMVFIAPGLLDPEKARASAEAIKGWAEFGDVAKDLIGDSNRRNEQNVGHSLATGLAEGLYFSAEPLSREQYEAMTAVFARNLDIAGLFIDVEAIMDQAKPHLTARQLEYLDLLCARGQFESRITRAIDSVNPPFDATTTGGGP